MKLFTAYLSALLFTCSLGMGQSDQGNTTGLQPTGPAMKIVNLMGTIEITDAAGKTVTVNPGDTLPDITGPVSITVISGSVVLQAGDNSVITAEAGSNFSASVTTFGNGSTQINVKVGENSAPIQQTVGGNTLTLSSKNEINISMAGAAGQAKIDVVTGSVAITDKDGNTQTVEAGKSADVAMPGAEAKAEGKKEGPGGPSSPSKNIGTGGYQPPQTNVVETQEHKEGCKQVSPSAPCQK